LLLHEIIAPHLPRDVFQLVLGHAGRALADHPDVAAVSFTGSVPVGREVVARVAGRGGRVQAEMGGQNAAIVLADADFGRAAAAIAYAAMGYAGQKCTATSRVIVEDAAYEEFRPQLVDAIAGLGVVGPSEEKTLVGPVINEQARASALDAIARSGGRVLAGGTALDAPGYYVAPTLVELDSPAGPLATEEVFAPVAALLRAPTPEAAAEIANGVRYGLVSSVFTSDLSRALLLTERLDAGMVRVNAPTAGVDFQAPFGGAKESSYGPREQGLAARDFYTETRTVTIVP
jgi:alpha-ketoglutaric semialdehyde dehydrogenase